MMKLIKLTLLLFLLAACEDIERKPSSSLCIRAKGMTPNDYQMYRCENNEVICYVISGSHRAGTSCKFKRNQNETN